MLPITDPRTLTRSNLSTLNLNDGSSSMALLKKSWSSSNNLLQDGRFPEYLRRLCDFRQMDFEATFDQMITILSNEPHKVYTSFYYRKQTKNQWARDDPAFAVVQGIFVGLSALAYAVAFHHSSVWGYVWVTFYAVFIDWLLIGMAFVTVLSYLANTYLRQRHAHTVEQEVEWMYAFDVHLNAFLCSFVITYILQYFLLPLLIHDSLLACLFSNTLYAISSIWYFYATHLGYRALPFLGNTQVFLWYPSIAVIVLWIFSISLLMLGLRVNISRIVMVFHYG